MYISYTRIILFIFILITNIFAQFNHPEIEWCQMNTQHTIIVYPDNNEGHQVAELVFQKVEKIYTKLSGWLNYIPSKKIYIILKNSDDIHSGYAEPSTPKIIISLDNSRYLYRDQNNSFLNTLAHELTHIIHLRTIDGFPEFLRFLTGDWVLPAGINPIFFTEGLAQYGSSLCGYDTLDSYRESILKQRILNNDFYTYSEMLALSPYKSPQEENHYNSGFSLIEYLAQNYGNLLFRKIINNSVRRAPFITIDDNLERTTGSTFSKTYQNWKKYLQKKYNVICDQKNYLKIIKPLKQYSSYLPVAKYQNYIIFSGKNNLYEPANLIAVNKDNPADKIIIEKYYDKLYNKIIVRDDALYYTKFNYDNNGNWVKDIYRYHFLNREKNRLTVNKHTSYPEVKNNILYYNKNVNGNSNIFRYNLYTKKEKQLTFTPFTHSFFDLYLDNYDRLWFSINYDNTTEIGYYHLKNHIMKKILSQKSHNFSHPIYKNNVLYFCSNINNNTYNVYSYDFNNNKIRQLTNAIANIFINDIEDTILICTYYDSNGYVPALLKIDDDKGILIKSNNLSIKNSDYTIKASIVKRKSVHTQRFNSFSHISPHIWYPWSWKFGNDRLYGGGIHLWDPFFKNYFIIKAGLNPKSKLNDNFYIFLNYSLAAFYPTFDITLSDRRYTNFTHDNKESNNKIEHLDLSMEYPLIFNTYKKIGAVPSINIHCVSSNYRHTIDNNKYSNRLAGISTSLSVPYNYYYNLNFKYTFSKRSGQTYNLWDENIPQVSSFGIRNTIFSSIYYKKTFKRFLHWENYNLWYAGGNFAIGNQKYSGNNYRKLLYHFEKSFFQFEPILNMTKIRLLGGLSAGDFNSSRMFSNIDYHLFKFFGINNKLRNYNFLAISIEQYIDIIDDLNVRFWMFYFNQLYLKGYIDAGYFKSKVQYMFKDQPILNPGLELSLKSSVYYLPYIDFSCGIAWNLSSGNSNKYFDISMNDFNIYIKLNINSFKKKSNNKFVDLY